MITTSTMAIAIFILTITLVIWQPQKLGRGWIAMSGALIALATGVVTWGDLIAAWQTLGDPLLTIAGLLIICYILEEAGFFTLIGRISASAANGNGQWLWLLLLLIAAELTTFFGNYAGILMITPIVIEAMRMARFRPKVALIFLLGTSFVAEVGSLLLPVNNPLSAIALKYFNISLLRYLMVIVPLHFVILLISAGILWFYFIPYIPLNYRLRAISIGGLTKLMRDPFLCRWGFVILSLLFLVNFFSDLSWQLTGLIAILTLALTGPWLRKSRQIINIKQSLRRIPWQLLAFTLGIYIIGIGLSKSEFQEVLSAIILTISNWGITMATTGTGLIAMLQAGLMHNFSALNHNNIIIQNLKLDDPALRESLIYANLIGCVIGAKITPIGSLSTLLWLKIIQRRGLNVEWWTYLRIYLALTIPLLAIVLIILAIWLPWLVA